MKPMDVCPECKVRDNDDSAKQLQLCHLCERQFCEKHIEPKMGFLGSLPVWELRDWTKTNTPRWILDAMEIDWGKIDRHPCIPYTRVKLKEMATQRRENLRSISDFLDKAKAIGEKMISEEVYYQDERGKILMDELAKVRKTTRIQKAVVLVWLLVTWLALAS